MSEGLLIVVSAPSGAGKTSLVRAVLAQDAGLKVSVSHTTRAMRPGETDGVNYHFVSHATFAGMIAEDAFIEHAEVFGQRYGTSRRALSDALAAGEDVVLEIDWQGAVQVRAAFPEHIASVFIVPPSIATLESRLTARGQDEADTIRRRMDEARSQMSHYKDYDYLIVNDDFETAVRELAAITTTERLRRSRQAVRHERLLASLLT